MNFHHRRLAEVPRWGPLVRIKTQSVAEHSFFVAYYTTLLLEKIPPQANSLLIVKLALLHDMGEAQTGDIVNPTKQFVKRDKLDKFESDRVGHFLTELTVRQKALVKLADLMDALAYCMGERAKGNQMVLQIESEVKGAFLGLVTGWEELDGEEARWKLYHQLDACATRPYSLSDEFRLV